MTSHILVIDAGYRNKRRALATAQDMGLAVSVIGRELPGWARPLVDHFIPANTYDIEETLAALRRAHARLPFDGVITFWDRAVGVVARVAAELGLPGSSIESAERARNKYKSRCALGELGVPQPRFSHVRSWEELVAAARVIGFPMICKPLGASGSKGIFKVDRPAQLRTTYEDLRMYVRPELDPMFSFYPGVFLAEQYMEGREVSVEGVVASGAIHMVGITEKWTTDEFFTEYQHAFPARLAADAADEVLRVAEAGVNALGIDNCGFHAELMLTAEGCKVVEINGRLGGDLITTHLVPLACGVDLVRGAFATALGQTPDLERTDTRGACARFLLAPRSGTLTTLNWCGGDQLGPGCHRPADLPGVVEFAVEKNVGELVMMPPAEFSDYRLAYVVTDGACTGEAIRHAEAALDEVECVLT
jgi:biotin carboxylase